MAELGVGDPVGPKEDIAVLYSPASNYELFCCVLHLVPLLQTFTYTTLAPSTRGKTYIYGIRNRKI